MLNKYWIFACVMSFASGLCLGLAVWTSYKGVCKSYDVEATQQTVEICTRTTRK